MNARRPFLYGFALGIMLATFSSYYHFCRPQQGQSVGEIFGIAPAAATPSMTPQR